MGQKANPIGNRLGIIRGWDSNWYGSKKDYANKLIEDHKIRTYLNARINKGGIAKIVIERTLGKLIVTIHTSKPGIIIGKGGGEVDRIKEELKKLVGYITTSLPSNNFTVGFHSDLNALIVKASFVSIYECIL